MITRNSLTALALSLLATAGVVTGSASARSAASAKSNGVASGSASQILAATTKAADSLKSVKVAGSGDDAGQTIGINLQIEAGVGSEGTIALGGESINLVVFDNTVYLKGSYSFWKSASSTAVAQLVAGKWLKAPDTGSFASFSKFGTVDGLFQTIFSSHGTLVKTATEKVDGTVAVGLHDTTKGGTLYVATTGQPLPLEIVNGKKSSVFFSDFNTPVKIAAPKGAISLAGLKSGA